MAASGWEYFAPYQEDIDKALQDFWEQIFRTGQFRKWPHVQSKTIEEVVTESGYSGTHFILDIERVSPLPALQTVSPLSIERLQEVFGTDKPMRQAVGDLLCRLLWRLRRRGKESTMGRTVTLDEIENQSVSELMEEASRRQEPLIVMLENGKAVFIQQYQPVAEAGEELSALKPILTLPGSVPSGWKDAIYDEQH